MFSKNHCRSWKSRKGLEVSQWKIFFAISEFTVIYEGFGRGKEFWKFVKKTRLDSLSCSHKKNRNQTTTILSSHYNIKRSIKYSISRNFDSELRRSPYSALSVAQSSLNTQILSRIGERKVSNIFLNYPHLQHRLHNRHMFTFYVLVCCYSWHCANVFWSCSSELFHHQRCCVRR